MRSTVLNAFVGGLGLAAMAASASASTPALSSPDSCVAPVTETIFVTESAKPSTVYLTVPASYTAVGLSELPVTTVTHVATLYSTTTAPYTSAGYSAVAPPSDTPPSPASSSVDGEADSLSYSYVYVTSTATVVPVDPTVWASDHSTSTLTLQLTIHSTQEVTLTKTLESVTSSVHGGSVSAGVGLPYVKPTGGWNATMTSSIDGVFTGTTNHVSVGSTGAGIFATGDLKPVSSSLAAQSGFDAISAAGGDPASFLLYSTFDIYQTSTPAITISSLAAQSGFNVSPTSSLTVTAPSSASFTRGPYLNSTSSLAPTGIPHLNSSSIASSISDPASATSDSGGDFTTAVINGQTVTWGGSSTEPCTETPYAASAGAPYGNLTNTGASGALTSLTSALPTESSSAHANSTIAASSQATGRESGIVTSLSLTSSSRPSSVPANSTGSGDPLLSLFSTVLAPSSSSSIANALTTGLNSSSAVVASFTSSFPGTNYTGLTSTLVTSTVSSSLILTSAKASSLSSSVVVMITPHTSSIAYAPSSSSLAPTSISSSKTSTSASSSRSASPSICGETGDFLLNFDDIPPLSIGNQNPNTVTPPPVFNPYHQFDFSDGFVVVPPPTDPYLPSSPPLLLEFEPNFNVNGTNTQAGPNTAELGYSGQISDGDRDQTGCFHFNVYGASFGCDSTGPTCVFTFSGYQLSAEGNEVQITSQVVPVPACPALANCTLTPVNLSSSFKGLAFMRINATVANQPKIWWMDDLHMGWYNNSCTTGLCRQTTHLH